MTWVISALRTAAVLGLTGFSAAEVRAQRVSSDPSPAEVASLLRTSGDPGAALSVLTQARGAQAQKKMDEIADTLVAIAISLPGSDQRSTSTRAIAQATLLQAGLGMTGIVGIDRGIPYSGATDRLMRLVETAQDVGIRGASLFALTQLPAERQLLPFLRKVATSQNPVAYRALTILTEETGTEGRAIARELYLSGGIVQPIAREMLEHFAAMYKWR